MVVPDEVRQRKSGIRLVQFADFAARMLFETNLSVKR